MTKLENNCIIKDVNPATMNNKHEGSQNPADFEEAIDATGFGLYNIILLVVSTFPITSVLFKTSVMSYVIPSAECDLKLTLMDKGTLNAIVSAGIISGCIFWGYISDTKGRKNALIFGYGIDFICVCCESMSQTVLQLQIFKFLGGFILAGQYGITLTYMAEMHSKAYRTRVLTFVGMILSIAGLVLAVLSLLILTNSSDLNIFGLQVRPWQLFLAISGIPSLVSAIALIFFAESPKFLMSQGKNEEALRIFQLMYSINYRKPKTDYPITQLVDELSQNHSNQQSYTPKNIVASAQTNKHKFISSFKQFRPLFGKLYLRNSLLIYLMCFIIFMSTDTFRLWLPQLFVSMSEYQAKFQLETASMCKVIEYSVNKTYTIILSNDNQICETDFDIHSAYNNIYVALTSLVGFSLMLLIVTLLSRRTILYAVLVTAPILILGLYFVTSSSTILMAVCLLTFLGLVVNTLVLDCSTILFPTQLRSMIISIAIMFARSGCIVGNLLFPVLIEVHCFAPFGLMAALYLLALLLINFLPNTQNMAMV